MKKLLWSATGISRIHSVCLGLGLGHGISMHPWAQSSHLSAGFASGLVLKWDGGKVVRERRRGPKLFRNSHESESLR